MGLVDNLLGSKSETIITSPENAVQFGSINVKGVNPYTGNVSGNYWSQTGMPWVSSEGRKAVLTEWFWQPIRGQPRRIDTNELRVFSETYWIKSCINTILNEITALDWDITPIERYEAFGNEYAIQKEVARIKDFFNNPNRNTESWVDIKRAWLRDLLQLDAGVLVKVYSNDSYDFDRLEPKSGAPLLKPKEQRTLTELYARDGASFLYEIDKFGFVQGFWQYSYQIPAHPMWFNRDEIIYVKQHPRSESPYGYSTPEQLMDVVKALDASTKWNRSFFEEGAIPKGLISLLDTSSEELKRIQTDWAMNMQAKPNQVPFVNKDIKYTPFDLSPNELEFLESQQWYMKLVISAFGLTPDEMGFTETSNRSVGESQAEVVRRKSIRPILKLIEYAINTELMPELGAKYTQYKYIVRDTSEERVKREMEDFDIRNNIRTVNEIRNERGLDPVPWGDVPPTQVSFGQFAPNADPNKAIMDLLIGDESRAREETHDDIEEAETNINVETPVSGYITGHESPKAPIITEQGGDPRTNPIMSQKYLCMNCDNRQASNKSCNECSGLIFKALPVQPVGAYYNDPRIEYGKNPLLDPATPHQLQTSHPNDKDKVIVPSNDPHQEANEVRCQECGFEGGPTQINDPAEQGSDVYQCPSCKHRFYEEEVHPSEGGGRITQSGQAEAVHEVGEHPANSPLHQNHYGDVSRERNPLVWSPKSADKKKEMISDWVGKDITSLKDMILEIVNNYSFADITDVSKAQIKRIRSVFAESIKHNYSLRSITNKLEEIVEDKNKAEAIARTELVRLTAKADEAKAKENDVEKMRWIAQPNVKKEAGHVCWDNHQKEFNIDNLPELPAHPNCNCYWEFVI